MTSDINAKLKEVKVKIIVFLFYLKYSFLIFWLGKWNIIVFKLLKIF